MENLTFVVVLFILLVIIGASFIGGGFY
ncbi:YjcZ family sporulation protein [Bacillus toyonensis]|nr:YjcZ family sporulation protein [Bacillus toyonensis]MDO8159593.1 YjcZ family sporulation protein [Bacillus toyonensis]